MKTTIVLFACLLIAGCVSTSQVIEVGRDAYTVSATADGMRSAASARESALEQAATKCRSAGRRLEVQNENSERTRMGIDTTYTINFRCMPQ